MTLRDVLAALWRRKWIVVAVTLLACMVAVGYLARQTPNYTSSTTVRVSPLMTQAAYAGQLAGIPVDADFSIITSDEVLDPAADALGMPAGSLKRSVTYTVQDSTSSSSATSIVVTATSSTADGAQDKAAAVATSLGQYLDAQVAQTTATLQTQLQTATDQAIQFQAQAAANPNDVIVASNLSQTLSRMASINTALTVVQSAGTSVTIISPASPGESTNPSKLIVGAVALLCGLLAGAGIALVRDHFDDRLRPEDDLEAISGLITLGTLAKDRNVARKRELLPAGSSTRTALSEGIRSLRTSLQVLLPEGKGVIVVTSVEPGDGKTFLSANLALSWARAGRKVVLIGGDLRRPQLSAYFPETDADPGLAGLLVDGAEDKMPSHGRIDGATQSTPHRGLRVLPAGKDALDPADLLAGVTLGRVIQYLARTVDIIVIDSPPALALADASELAAHADGVVLVTTMNRTKRGLIGETVRALQSNGANLLGIVVNRAKVALPRSYGSYYVDRARGSRATPASAQKSDSESQADVGENAKPADDESDDRASVTRRSSKPRVTADREAAPDDASEGDTLVDDFDDTALKHDGS